MNDATYEERLSELLSGSRVRTAYDPREFIELYEEAPSERERERIREGLRQVDSGRFHDFLSEAHTVLAHSDRERREHFSRNYSTRMIRWVKAYGTVEELNTFPKIPV